MIDALTRIRDALSRSDKRQVTLRRDDVRSLLHRSDTAAEIADIGLRFGEAAQMREVELMDAWEVVRAGVVMPFWNAWMAVAGLVIVAAVGGFLVHG